MNGECFKITRDILEKINSKEHLKFEPNVVDFQTLYSDKAIKKRLMLGHTIMVLDETSRVAISSEEYDNTITIKSCYDIMLDDNAAKLFSETKFISVDFNGVISSNVTDMAQMFYGCENLSALDVSNFNTSNVTDMAQMFNGCENLTSLDVSNFDTSKVTDMSAMFSDTSVSSLYLHNFNTSHVKDMMYMFCNTPVTMLDLSSFDTSNVENMEGMFDMCHNLVSLNVSSFNTSKAYTMEKMFKNCKKLDILDLGSFDTSNVIYMKGAFENARINKLIIGNFDLSKSIDSISEIFKGAEIDTLHIKKYTGYENIKDILIESGISKNVIINNCTILHTKKPSIISGFTWNSL